MRMMKLFFLWYGMLCFYSSIAQYKNVYDSLFYANDWRKLSSTKVYYDSLYGDDWLNKMLRIGDKVPEIYLGEMKNCPNVKEARISDFKGKLIILDFWSTSCYACIQSFSKMESLQNRFGKRIQIILVNTHETEAQIRKAMGKNIYKIPRLPSVVSAKQLFPYFPRRWSPYHVWIDPNGIVRVLGSDFNTYEKKIDDLLNGKEIFSWNDECTRPGFNPDISYSELMRTEENPGRYNSFFTRYNNDYAPNGKVLGSSVTNKLDSFNNTIRNTFINWTIQELYCEAFKSTLAKQFAKQDNFIFNPYFLPLYEVGDSLRYTNSFDCKPLVDTQYIKSMFSYEQTYPVNVSSQESQQMMAQDLNAYFGKLYGTYGCIEKRCMPAYAIVRLVGDKYRGFHSKIEEFKEIRKIKKGKKVIIYQAISFDELILSVIIDKHRSIEKRIWINEAAIDLDSKIDLEIPLDASLADIKAALKPYGLDIIDKNVEIELLVISDIKPK